MSTKKPASTPTKTSEKPSEHSAAKTPGDAAPKQAKKKCVKKECAKKESRAKVIRKSFAMPKDEYQKLSEIKKTCLKAGLSVKKGEVLRAGLKALCGMTNEQLKQAMAGLGKSKGIQKKS